MAPKLTEDAQPNVSEIAPKFTEDFQHNVSEMAPKFTEDFQLQPRSQTDNLESCQLRVQVVATEGSAQCQTTRAPEQFMRRVRNRSEAQRSGGVTEVSQRGEMNGA